MPASHAAFTVASPGFFAGGVVHVAQPGAAEAQARDRSVALVHDGQDLEALVGQEFRHHEGGRAAVDDDGLALHAHRHRLARDGALARYVAADVVLEGFAGMRQLRPVGRQVLGPAAGAGEQVAGRQPADVAPDRRRRRVEPLDELLDRRGPVFGKQFQQTLAAFVVHHVFVSCAVCYGLRRCKSIHLDTSCLLKRVIKRINGVNHKLFTRKTKFAN
jgi:hypothetical protein